MSGTVPRGREATQHAEAIEAPEATEPGGLHGRARWIALAIVVVVAAGVSAWQAGAFSPASPSGSGQQGAPAATAAVTRQEIVATMPVNATLGYAGSYSMTGHGSGTLTWLPGVGQVIGQGQVLYRTDNGSPVALLYGSVPDWRAMSVGTTGQDVSQLNHALVSLGYASRADIVASGWDYYSWATASAVQKLEEHLGVSSPSENLSLGQVEFEPEALRVATLTGSLGGSASGSVLTATSNRHSVTISLDVSDQGQVKVGDKVTVTLPDQSTTPGVVTSIGTVATTQALQGIPTTTIPVQVTLTNPRAAGTLVQAPVTVNVTTETSPGPVLTVPVTALQAQSSGGYVVEVVGPGNVRQYVPVTSGIFDDANGLVQVSGALTPGQRVVVPAS